ncbi:MAG TPA: hypothetical protein VFO27_00040 [Bryobacteraceae bacterium]|nr:hypothetical protein [Bryobacteraceae bacterium]
MKRATKSRPRMVAYLHYEAPAQPEVVQLENGATLIHCSAAQIKSLRLREDIMAWVDSQAYPGKFQAGMHKAYVLRDRLYLRAMLGISSDVPPTEVGRHNNEWWASRAWDWTHLMMHQEDNVAERFLPIGRYV